ncbi:uncharacterized [Tachysurus ichikawai]
MERRPAAGITVQMPLLEAEAGISLLQPLRMPRILAFWQAAVVFWRQWEAGLLFAGFKAVKRSCIESKQAWSVIYGAAGRALAD